MSDAIPLPCSRCGRAPTIDVGYHRDAVMARHTFQVVCRRWLVWSCSMGPLHYIQKGWGDLGMRRAIERWNEGERA